MTFKSRIFHTKSSTEKLANSAVRPFSTLFQICTEQKRRIKSIKIKYCEIVALGILNCPLIIPYRLTKNVQIQQNNSQNYNNNWLLDVTLLTLVMSLLTGEQFCYVRTSSLPNEQNDILCFVADVHCLFDYGFGKCQFRCRQNHFTIPNFQFHCSNYVILTLISF